MDPPFFLYRDRKNRQKFFYSIFLTVNYKFLKKISFLSLIGLKKNVFYALFIIGIILGPMYSMYLYSQYSDAYLQYNNKYYQVTSNSDPLLEKNNYTGSIMGTAFDVVNHSAFALFQPNSPLHSNNSLDLLEINLSGDLNNIFSSQVIKIPVLSENAGTEPYSRAFFDGSRFWAFYYPNNQFNFTLQIYFFSFNKNGSILSNSTAFIHHDAGLNPIYPLHFLGIYDNYFFVADLDNSSLLIFSATNLSASFTISLSELTNGQPFATNLDHQGLLWVLTNSDTQLKAFSAQDLLDSQTSPIQKVIKIPSNNYPAFFYNSTFNGIDVGTPLLSIPFVNSNHFFYIQYGSDFTVIEGVYINNISKVVLPLFDIFVNFLGYLLCISELIGIVNMKYFSK